MENTPKGLRRHIALIGKTNSGKSTLFNLLTGQDAAIVSDSAGTTTDPVLKNIEFIPFGPVTFIDTAGLDDTTNLGKQRIKKTIEFFRRTDLGLIICEALQYKSRLQDEDISFTGDKIYVFTKTDLADYDTLEEIKRECPNSVQISKHDQNSIEILKQKILKKLTDMEKHEEETLIGDLLPYDSTIVMVIPLDSEAPKGRLILPQVQLIRDCLDHGIKAYITRETELKSALCSLDSVNLVVTDSQAFKVVDKIVPAYIPLTSFSILLARQKGNFNQLLKGVEHIKNLKNNDKILMLEACTHSHTHDDIGRVKIPKLISEFTKINPEFVYYSGYSMPSDLKEYSMAVLCGGCMINKREILSRLKILEENKIPSTNYGIVLAYLNGILDRCARACFCLENSEFC